ncbi:FGGY-family carbohydrate kinase [Nitratireductor sp. XY-223]|uniref:FGGY-family carbohydrate kinase n=1 Tax=Nitratireductor sp. XY-223 TaxID=2561926 RepID=UPI0010AA16B2|nr:FGGY-family carbohydrate kinase [Nitratireductor sp. XY-223]
MTGNLHLGLDVGTTAVKAAVYDSHGAIRALEDRESNPVAERSGWSSQPMEAVWQTAADAIKSVSTQVGAQNIGTVGVCAQGDGLWLLDEQGRPVRDAILWNDQRAVDYVTGWIEDGTADRLARFSRTAIWPGTSGAAYRWLKDHEPENAARARHAINCKDWINLRLTGQLTTDYTDATIPFLDLESGRYAPEAFAMLGVEELQDKLVDPLRATGLNGAVDEAASGATGLPVGTPVAAGCIDVAAMISGMGLAETGDICLILGTTAVVAVIVEPEAFSGPQPGATLAHPYADKWIRVLAPLSGASALDWFTSLDSVNYGGADAAEVIQRLNSAAASVPAGANGVVFVPFLSGERAPVVAPHATASFHGITSATTQADLARAVMEGAAMSLRQCFQATGAATPGQIFMTGGGARNALWCDIIASVMNTTIVASDSSDHGVWGAAMIGACAGGMMDIARPPVRDEALRRHRPDGKMVASYNQLFQLYENHVASSPALWNARRDILGGPS